jgi:hypothetical protein
VADQTIHVAGRVVRAGTRQGVANVRVDAWDNDLLVDDVVGRAVTNEAGEFDIAIAPRTFQGLFFDRRVDLYFRVYAGDTLLAVTKDRTIWNIDAPEAVVTIEVGGEGAVTDGGPRRVDGHVYLPQGQPAQELDLRLVSRGLGGEAGALGSARTDGDGAYTIRYLLDARGNIELHAATGDGTGVPLTRTIFSPDPLLVLDVVAPMTLQPTAAEQDRLLAALRPHLGDRRLADLVEDDRQHDITVLSRLSGWDARLLAVAWIAARLADDSDVRLPEKLLYGLLRAGLPQEKGLLANVEPASVQTALRNAVDNGIIEASDAELNGFIEAFGAFAARVGLTLVAPGSNATYADMLDAAGLDDRAKSTFAIVLREHQGSPEELWTQAHEHGLSDDDVAALQMQGKLAYLTGNSLPMMQHLADLGIDDLDKLVTHDLYLPERWRDEVERAGQGDPAAVARIVPPSYAGEPAERVAAYASDLANRVRLSFPTQAVARTIERAGDNGFGLGEHAGDTVQLLRDAASAGYRLGQTPVHGFLDSHPDVVKRLGGERAAQATQDVAALHRMYQVTPSDDALQKVMSAGFTSAGAVAALPREAFVRRLGESMGVDEATTVHQRSQQVAAATLAFVAEGQKLARESAPYVMQADTTGTLAAAFPTMETLFGAQDYCECEECRSVLSPAAYLVDLLHFIDPDAAEWSATLADWTDAHHEKYTDSHRKPFDALVQRRPDVPHLALTCENTNTALPYIDLVNEILEYDVAYGGLPNDSLGDTGDAASEDLLAEPARVRNAAYELLAGEYFPLTLPFDLFAETARRFAERLGVPLWQLVRLFGQADAANLERLGVTAKQRHVFATPAAVQWQALYGYAAQQDALVALRSAKTLARRLGVSYVELAEVVGTGFVNPRLADLQVLQKLGVSLQDALRHYGLADEPDDPPPDSIGDQTFADLVAELGKRLGVRDLEEALKDRFTSHTYDHVLLLRSGPGGECDFDQTAVEFVDGTLVDDETLTRINLLVRLKRLSGWSFASLDRILVSLTPRVDAHGDPVTPTLDLNLFARVFSLAARLGVDEQGMVGLTTLWSDLGTTGDSSLYQQLFLRPSATTHDAAFDDVWGNYLQSAEPMTGHLAALQGELGLAEAEIRLVMDDLVHDPAAAVQPDHSAALAAAPLTRGNVSALYRYRLLADLLDLSVPDLVAFRRMAGLESLGAIAPPAGFAGVGHRLDQVEQLLDHLDRMRGAGMEVTTVRHLLLSDAQPAGNVPLGREAAEQHLTQLVADLRAVREAHHVPEAANLSEAWLRQELGSVLEPEVVDRFLALLDTPLPQGSVGQSEHQEFFDAHLLRQGSGETQKGFLEAGDFATVFGADAPEEILLRNTRLAEALVPVGQERLLRAHVLQDLAVVTGAARPLVQTLATDSLLVPGPADPGGVPTVLEALMALGRPDAVVTPGVVEALVRFGKATRVGVDLLLVVDEVRYFAGHDPTGAEVVDVTWPLGTLPSSEVTVPPTGAFEALEELWRYVALRGQLCPGRDALLGVVDADPAPATAAFAAITRRTPEVVTETLAALPGAWLASVAELERVWAALQAAERLGVGAAMLADWAQITNADDAHREKWSGELVRSVKTRVGTSAWRMLARPVFDDLRRSKRDALVAYLTHRRGFTGSEEMYEHYLVDPGMEPVVLSSRIRLAISSVQLFVQRCLLNLESQVPPSVIRSDMWAWMKRYRVWEANRKIFLYPENWLEPEFRQDKSHLFKDLEGALLRGDASDDAVEDAFLAYLRGLEEIARLTVVATHLEGGANVEDRVLHVVARSLSEPARYFYRRFAVHSWTPWEPIPVDISGDHVAPVIWRNRLFVFWVTFLKHPVQVKEETVHPASDGVLIAVPRSNIDFQLHWTELVHGAWSTHKSGPVVPVVHGEDLALAEVAADFDPATATVHVEVEHDGDQERGVWVAVGGEVDQSFYLAGRTSAPARRTWGGTGVPRNPYSITWPQGSRYAGQRRLAVSFANRITSKDGDVASVVAHPVIGLGYSNVLGDFSIVLPNTKRVAPMLDVSSLTAVDPDEATKLVRDSREEIAALSQPLFYQDSWHTFFLEPDVTETLVSEWAEWVETVPPSPVPPVVIVPFVPPLIQMPFPRDPVGPVIHPDSILPPVVGVDWLANPATGLLLGAGVLGSAGHVGPASSAVLAAGTVSLVGLMGASSAIAHGLAG